MADPGTPLGTQKAHTLAFTTRPADNKVEVLVVAGGGGGAKRSTGWSSSGGGAGRFVYHPAFNVADNEIWGSPGTISVKVGAGGAGAGNVGYGGTGGDSEFIRGDGYKIIAKGGGGGGYGGSNVLGLAGGSGGGSHNSNENPPSQRTSALEGTVPNEPGVLNLGSGGHTWNGGGAGEGSGGAGIGTQSAISGESKWYAGGGHNGANAGIQYGAGNSETAESGTGDGGGAGPSPITGTAGGSGIVIVRWPWVEPETPKD
ncbi:MAG: hypothetical protein LBK66_07260 [Spirochaetaceae bacterium]|jgi:hypothetical protein|nr:hypothetical protein [Spirochaetaceae bacterium]